MDFSKCDICPRECGVNRIVGETGFCGQTAETAVARAALHFWEEPCISGENGSGAVFFSGCQLKCVFCQNAPISSGEVKKTVSTRKLADIFINLQKQKAHNINLVTPTHFLPNIIQAVKLAKEDGLTIPIVYNSSGYDKVSSLKLLEGIVDVYLPDFKYFSDELAAKYSNAKDYFERASAALAEMTRQAGKPVFDENGVMQKGVIARHLVLPSHTDDSKKVLKYLYETYGDDIYVCIMNQFTPMNLQNFEKINRKLTKREYNSVVDYAISLGIENGFIQEGETAKESFIPSFNFEGIDN